MPDQDDGVVSEFKSWKPTGELLWDAAQSRPTGPGGQSTLSEMESLDGAGETRSSAEQTAGAGNVTQDGQPGNTEAGQDGAPSQMENRETALLSKGGTIRNESQKSFDNDVVKDFLVYPLDRAAYSKLLEDNIRAELFTRLGLLYLGEPKMMREALPNAYSTYHEVFGLDKESPVSGAFVFRKVWGGDAARRGKVRGDYGSVLEGRGDAARAGSQRRASEGLGRIRQGVARSIQGKALGVRADLKDRETRPSAGFSVSGDQQPRIEIPRERVQALTSALTSRMANAPEVVVVQNMQDEAVPQAVRDEDAQQRSQGARGEPEGFYHQGRAFIVMDGLIRQPGESDAQAVLRVFSHTARPCRLRG